MKQLKVTVSLGQSVSVKCYKKNKVACNPSNGKRFLLFQNNPDSQLALCIQWMHRFFPGSKVVTHLHLVLRLKWVELYYTIWLQSKDRDKYTCTFMFTITLTLHKWTHEVWYSNNFLGAKRSVVYKNVWKNKKQHTSAPAVK